MMSVNRKYAVPFSLGEMDTFSSPHTFSPPPDCSPRGSITSMWFEQSEACRKAVLDFWREQAKD